MMKTFATRFKLIASVLCTLTALSSIDAKEEEPLNAEQLRLVEKLEKQRINTISKVIGSVISIYGEERQGGGSGVIIDPSGIGLTNHHVIMGAGVKGWGGLADGKMYRWKLIGTDPGGDVAVIQMVGKDNFPFTPLGDSDRVQVGDWSLAMGNPFVLTEDQSPTVTLGIVSGVKRYQPGAGNNSLVYGNCIQTDSSINPGNSGGPLFSMQAEVIGINGRGSFKERGRVNVGLGYAISANQIKNFIPDLLATKLVEHGTLDANFEDRNGKVVCSNLFEDSKLHQLGVRPGDELVEFEGERIETANHFTNLICTLPEDWPAKLTVRNKTGQETTVYTRLYGLPYNKPTQPRPSRDEKERTPEQREQEKRAVEMRDLLSAPPGTVRMKAVNQIYAKRIIDKWTSAAPEISNDEPELWKVVSSIWEEESEVGVQTLWLASNGLFKASIKTNDSLETFFRAESDVFSVDGNETRELSLVETKLCPAAVQALGILAANKLGEFKLFGETILDGGDKAHSKNAYRFKIVDSDEDPFFFWLNMAEVNSQGRIDLVKAGADIDCDQQPGGILFDDWTVVDGLRIAKKRMLIRGLSENVSRTFQTRLVEKIAFDEALLKVDSNKEAGANETD